jgi:hypothetical protein
MAVTDQHFDAAVIKYAHPLLLQCRQLSSSGLLIDHPVVPAPLLASASLNATRARLHPHSNDNDDDNDDDNNDLQQDVLSLPVRLPCFVSSDAKAHCNGRTSALREILRITTIWPHDTIPVNCMPRSASSSASSSPPGDPFHAIFTQPLLTPSTHCRSCGLHVCFDGHTSWYQKRSYSYTIWGTFYGGGLSCGIFLSCLSPSLIVGLSTHSCYSSYSWSLVSWSLLGRVGMRSGPFVGGSRSLPLLYCNIYRLFNIWNFAPWYFWL